MDDAAAGGHPLDVTGGDGAVIPHAVAVFHGPGKNVRDGFDAAVRMPRETRQIIFRNIVAKVVEEKKRVEVRGVAKAERTAQVHARTFHRWLGFDEPLHRSNQHSASSRESLTLGCKAANGASQRILSSSIGSCTNGLAKSSSIQGCRRILRLGQRRRRRSFFVVAIPLGTGSFAWHRREIRVYAPMRRRSALQSTVDLPCGHLPPNDRPGSRSALLRAWRCRIAPSLEVCCGRFP